ncbi:hypothetical protein SETIT_8G044600v2 [Setaria italica]|uniref:Ubiquitin-like protease family profile domain-containing protein n=1 Tax=Setaria italica TaxID=4555 RepID=K3ZM28_SETIT|nr:hypothetical protein SETIT_8G044600v2 [Setaria italica]
MKDDDSFAPECSGYRVLLHPKVSTSKYTSEQILKARDVFESPCLVFLHNIMFFSLQIFLPVCYKYHWTLYVVNYSSEQIDILDSRVSTKRDKTNCHQKINSKIRTGLYDALNTFTNNKMTPFNTWVFHFNGCGFFVMIFLKQYNTTSNVRRSKILWYLLFHELNKSGAEILVDIKMTTPDA